MWSSHYDTTLGPSLPKRYGRDKLEAETEFLQETAAVYRRTVTDTIQYVEEQREAVQEIVNRPDLLSFNILIKVLRTGNGKRLNLDEDNEENVRAIFTLLAMITKENKEKPDHQFLIEQSTTTVPLSTYRREYIALLKLLYRDCFYTNGRFFLPIVDSDRLEPAAKTLIMGKINLLLAEAICKRVFNGVEQLTCGSLTLTIPTVKDVAEEIAITRRGVYKQARDKTKLLQARKEHELIPNPEFARKQELKKNRAKENRKNLKEKVTKSASTKTKLTLEQAKRLLPHKKTQKRNSKEADMAEAYSDMENIDVFDFVEGLEREEMEH